jgi:hypothetical protein
MHSRTAAAREAREERFAYSHHDLACHGARKQTAACKARFADARHDHNVGGAVATFRNDLLAS